MPQILAIYGAGCWTVVQIVEWIIDRYLISPHLTDLCLIGMLSFIPSVAIIAYFHGTPGRDKWHPIEKIGIPINIIASVLILFIAFYPKDLGAITETVIVEDDPELRRPWFLVWPGTTRGSWHWPRARRCWH